MYVHVFELILRLKGNYLWPAMWGKAFNDDDPENYKLADMYGVVVSTSHHEPMMRAQDEWHRNKDKGVTGGKWDYTKNAENLRTFWRGGIERMASKPGGGTYESVVTIGMRGDGDEPMSEGTATQLLEQIVADQRKIIADVTGRPPEQTPQVWALYKEVQDYYDHGMKVPDDVLLLFADDNWGQIRRLPVKDKNRAGGYGVYYHFDYVGGPRNYKWLNTNQIEKAWQQMDLAYKSGADRLWIVNVGDIKPVEYPLSFFMDMAWNPEAMDIKALGAYPQKWAAQQFGQERSVAIGDMLTRYSQLAARRKPELVDPDFMRDHKDAETLIGDWSSLLVRSNLQRAQLPAGYDDAWYQLMQYPVEATENVYQLYWAVARNRLRASQNDPAANPLADRAEALFAKDKALSDHYNLNLAGGKWKHMMDQTHIGYTGWQQPETNIMPEVRRVPATAKAKPAEKGSPVVFVPLSEEKGFKEVDGQVSIEAESFDRVTEAKGLKWTVIPHLGRTKSAVIATPQAAAATTSEDAMTLEYDLSLKSGGEATLSVYLAPTLDVRGEGGLKFAVSVNDQAPQTLSFDLRPDTPDWNKAVSDNAVVLKAHLKGLKPGTNVLKVHRLSDNVILQKLVLATKADVPVTYLGPPQSPAKR